MTTRRVLISGASIAGPALAYWLNEFGIDTVVVERAEGIRPGGQTVDLRGAGRIVAQRMGIEDAVRAAFTGEDGVAFVDENNVTKAAFGVDAFGGEGFVAELEILRGELANLLYQRTRDSSEYLFGDRITALTETAGAMHVGFERGAARDFDLVVAADGIGSSTRKLVFGEETTVKSLGLYTAYLTIPRADSDGSWARWHNAPGGRTLTLRPDNLGTTRALMSFLSGPRGYDKLGAEQQKSLLRTVFRNVGWEAPRVLDGLDESADFYFEQIGQVYLPTWSRGRFAVLGDAGYCASPISGMGTSLALVGAYVLAGELAGHADHADAFRSYEAIMRPYVRQAQHLPPFVPRVASPRTTTGIRVLNALLAVAARPQVRRLGSKLFTPPADAIDLPEYSAAGTAPIPASRSVSLPR